MTIFYHDEDRLVKRREAHVSRRTNGKHTQKTVNRATSCDGARHRRTSLRTGKGDRMGMQSALAEKDALLSELRHRIKNSLTVITSLVSLEADYAPETSTRECLERVMNRVTSVAKLYELLGESGEMREVKLAEYLHQVIASLFASYGPRTGAVDLQVRCDNVVLNVRQAAPLGLIVNELVTNAFKHGFPNHEGGTVSVMLEQKDHNITLEVSDTGIALPPTFTVESSCGLGLQIVQMLAAQLGGALEIVHSPAAFRLAFRPAA